MVSPAPALVVFGEGRIATLTTARKHHRCCVGGEYILPKTKYYSIVLGGSGLGSLKFPERCCVEHLPAYFEKVKRSRGL